MNIITFGERFKQLRLEKNLTQQELVNDFNNFYGYTFTKSAISQYENNNRKPEVEALIHFASYFDVTIDFLLGINDIRNIEANDTDIIIINDEVVLNYVEDLFNNVDINRTDKDMLFKEISNLYFKSLKTNK